MSKYNEQFYINMQAFYNPEHVQASKEAWDAMDPQVRNGLEAMDHTRENWFLVYDRNNPDKNKNAPVDDPEWRERLEEVIEENTARLDDFWSQLDDDKPWGGNKRDRANIYASYGRVTYITKEELPEVFRKWGAVSQHNWADGYFYGYDWDGKPFKQVITTVSIKNRGS